MAWENLGETPLENPDLILFTDGSSFEKEGTQRAGYVVVSLTKTIENSPLPLQTSAQLAELRALTIALKVSKGRRVNIYTDLRYVFLVLCSHVVVGKREIALLQMGPLLYITVNLASYSVLSSTPRKWLLYMSGGIRRE